MSTAWISKHLLAVFSWAKRDASALIKRSFPRAAVPLFFDQISQAHIQSGVRVYLQSIEIIQLPHRLSQAWSMGKLNSYFKTNLRPKSLGDGNRDSVVACSTEVLGADSHCLWGADNRVAGEDHMSRMKAAGTTADRVDYSLAWLVESNPDAMAAGNLAYPAADSLDCWVADSLAYPAADNAA